VKAELRGVKAASRGDADTEVAAEMSSFASFTAWSRRNHAGRGGP